MMRSLLVTTLAGSLHLGFANLKYMVWDGCQEKPGNFHNGTTRAAALDSVTDTAAVRCCRNSAVAVTGIECETDVNGQCNSGISWGQAKQVCETSGWRLCTLTELQSNVCCGTGCDYDYMTNIWTSTPATIHATRTACFPQEDGVNFTAETPTAMAFVLCFKQDSMRRWKECSSIAMMHGAAAKCCDSITEMGGGWKLPVLDDFDGSEDHCAVMNDGKVHIWTDEPYSFVSPMAAMDGCKIRNYGSNAKSSGGKDFYYNTFEKHAVRCCSWDGGQCVTATRLGCEDSATWYEAQEACHEQGLRLCTASEINDDKCCVTGCMFDVDRVWTQSLSPVYRLHQKNETGVSCNYKADVSSSSETPYGVVCCDSDGGCVDPAQGTCTKTKPSEAAVTCAFSGKELCRDSRLCSRCKETKCYTDGEYILGFKSVVT